MKDIKVKVNDLIQVLQKNRENHIKDYEESMIGYKKSLIAELKRITKYAKNGEYDLVFITSNKPTNHSENYDFMLAKLVATSDEFVELTDQEFRQYYLDEWSWKRMFETTTNIYKNVK